MESLISRLVRRFFADRRVASVPVPVNRRGNAKRKVKSREVDELLSASIDRFSQTVVRHRDDIQKKCAANDMQQVVIFSTLPDVCQFHGPHLMDKRLCRHPSRREAMAYCEEDRCPVIRQASKAEAVA